VFFRLRQSIFLCVLCNLCGKTEPSETEEATVPVHKSAILILRCQDWSETSQVVILLAREVGRLRCLAKGSRRGLNPFSGPLDRWTVGEAVFSLTDPNRLTPLMELFETERFQGFRDKLPAFYGASCLTELVMALVPEAEPQPDVFDLVLEALRLLDQGEPEACPAVTYAAAWRLLERLGYVAPMNRCVQCEQPLDPAGPMDFSAGLGGPVCPACRPPKGTHHLSGKAAQAIAFLLEAPWDEVRRVRLSRPTADQLRAVLGARVEELAGRKLSALRYV
jgi:DNA repair protein RecO (recombination protein O)